ncbi:TPA: toprim domain-containing protein [Providencia rettgeri]
MNTIDAAQGQWAKIFAHYGLPHITGKRHFKGKCPICEQKGKFRIDDKDGRGTYICKCSAGTGFQLLERTQGKDFKTLADEVDQLIGNVREKEAPKQPVVNAKADYQKRLISCFSGMPSLKNTSAAQYLQERGIFSLPADHVRFCENQPVKQSGKVQHFQAMWAIATDSKGKACYLHRTYLNGSKKAPIPLVKKANALQADNYLKHADSVAIRMFPVASTLGIAEGIETALSCKQIYGVNTWSTMNAQFMEKFIAPKGVKHLIIFADNDWSATGEAAAYACANKNLLSNNDIEKVSVRYPDLGDFNDLLIQGCEVRERVYIRKQREVA